MSDAPTQAQSDAIWDILEGNPAVVSLLHDLGARPIPEGAQDRSWERVKNTLVIGECDFSTADRLSSFTSGRA